MQMTVTLARTVGTSRRGKVIASVESIGAGDRKDIHCSASSHSFGLRLGGCGDVDSTISCVDASGSTSLAELGGKSKLEFKSIALGVPVASSVGG